MPEMGKARIISTGSYLPEQVLSNADLEKIVDTTDEWIVTRTGMRERRIAAENENPSDMGTHAAKIAIEKAGYQANDIELILVATMSSDYPNGCPSTAVLIQEQLGAKSAAAVDIQAACTGYVYALSAAKAYIDSGIYRRVLVIGTEKMSSIIDYEDRNTCILFGDGAAAAVISSEGEGFEIESTHLGADGSLNEILIIPSGGSRKPTSNACIESRENYLKMNGREVFKNAVRRMGESAEACIEKAGCSQEDVDWFIPHQANVRIIDALAKKMNIPLEKVCKTIDKYGNTSASSIGIALDELTEKNKILKGERLILTAAGAGFTWGAILLKKI